MINKEKNVTGHTEESLVAIESQYAVDSFLIPLLDTIAISPGTLKYPLIDVILPNDTNYLLKDIELAKKKEYSEAVLTDETLEDSSNKVSVGSTLTKLLSTKNLKTVEQSIVNTMLTDTDITKLELAVTWPGINSAIIDMGSPVFSIEGSIYVILSLPRYLDIIGSKEYSEASKILKNKVVLMPSEHLEDTAMLVFHEYGVVGGVSSEKEYIQRKPSLGASIHSVVQTYATGWHYSFIRIIDVFRHQYIFDGIDDYIQLPTIPLFVGDVVEFETKLVDRGQVFYLCDAEAPRTYVLINSSDALQFSTGNITVKVDDITKNNLDDLSGVFDGSFHKFALTAFSSAAIDVLSTRYSIANFAQGVIKNLRITRANPTDQYPNLFWPIDDGPGATIIRQTIPHTHKIDGTESFDSDGAIWLDYETEAAPQYVGVTGYETLAERAALSGLSEHDEAVASCREGLIKNGDFRFGADSSWTIQGGASFEVIDDEAMITRASGVSGITQVYNLEVGKEYVAKFTARVGTAPNVNVRSGIAGWTSNDYFAVNGTGEEQEVKFTATSTTAYFTVLGGTTLGDTFYIKGIELRKITDQQVLSPYVNHGTPVNFNDERWERV